MAKTYRTASIDNVDGDTTIRKSVRRFKGKAPRNNKKYIMESINGN